MTLDHRLQTLEGSGLIRLIASRPELEYLFRHALVQEATYHTLVKQDRKRLHLVVGETLERAYPEHGADLAPILARHFAEAGDARRALLYYTQAGDHVAGRYANAEAVMHYTRALEIVTADSNTPTALLSELYVKRGRSLELNGQYTQALAHYEAMLEASRQRGDRPLELTALVLLAQTRSTPNPGFDAAEGARLADQALELAHELGDPAAEAKILWNLVNLCAFTGRLADGIQYGERALHIAQEMGLREQLAYILNDIWRAYLGNHQWERAVASVQEASRLWRELQNLPMLTDSLATLADVYLFSGQYDDALQVADEAWQLSRSIHNTWGESYSQFVVGSIHWDRGEPARAIAVMEASIRLSIEAGFTAPQSYTRAQLALVYGALGDIPYGLELAKLAEQSAAAQFPAFRPHAFAVLVLLHLMQGAQAEAETLLASARVDLSDENPMVMPAFLQATITLALAQHDYPQALQAADDFIAFVTRMHTRYAAPDALYLKALALLESGRLAEAHAAFLEAQRAAESLSARRLEWPILMGLSAIAAQTGQLDQAADLRRRACEIVTYIAEHAPERLRASFLALPAVQATGRS